MRPPLHPDGFRETGRARATIAPRQLGFDDVESPLHEVTFCAVDLETTGGSPKDSEIVELGAIKSRGGEVLGTFDTLVRPAVDLPLEIQVLTGIRPAMLGDALPLPAVLPAFLEFSGGCVFVAHNARFDHSFIQRACELLDHPPLDVTIVDTAKLARRLLKGDVPNVKLGTLARFFRTPHSPNHRAFPDAAACMEVLWGLLERAAAYGVTTLADLLELQRPRSNPHYEKVRLAKDLPRRRGIYAFRNARREVIYVGKATDLRSRVRSYFTSDERKRIGDLLAEIHDVIALPCPTDVEAQGLEARLIEHHRPRYNRRGVRRRAPVWLRLTSEHHPRFAVARTTGRPGTYLGPFGSQRRAREAATTLSGLWGIRTCTMTIPEGTALEPCALYDLGACRGPCTGRPEDAEAHTEAVRGCADDLRAGLDASRRRLAAKLGRLASQRRFEEAAGHRDAFADVARVVDRAQTLQALGAAGRLTLSAEDGPVTLSGGRIAGTSVPGIPPAPQVTDPGPLSVDADGLHERDVVASWLRRAPMLRLEAAERPWASAWPRATDLDRIELESGV